MINLLWIVITPNVIIPNEQVYGFCTGYCTYEYESAKLRHSLGLHKLLLHSRINQVNKLCSAKDISYLDHEDAFEDLYIVMFRMGVYLRSTQWVILTRREWTVFSLLCVTAVCNGGNSFRHIRCKFDSPLHRRLLFMYCRFQEFGTKLWPIFNYFFGLIPLCKPHRWFQCSLKSAQKQKWIFCDYSMNKWFSEMIFLIMNSYCPEHSWWFGRKSKLGLPRLDTAEVRKPF